MTRTTYASPGAPRGRRLGRQPVTVAIKIQPTRPNNPPRSKAEFTNPAPRPERLPSSLAVSTTIGANTNAMPVPTRNRRTATSRTELENDVARTDDDERIIP